MRIDLSLGHCYIMSVGVFHYQYEEVLQIIQIQKEEGEYEIRKKDLVRINRQTILYILMGSDNSKLYAEREIPEEFKQVSAHPDIFQNVLTGARLQRHIIYFSSQAELQHEKDIFIFRRMHSDRFLVPHYFENTNKQSFCSHSFQICYFVELPSHSLALHEKLHTEKAFTLLIESLKGFELLFEKFGPFKVSPKQLFFDNKNNLKLWISNNPFATKVSPSSVNQHQMVQEIFDIFDVLRDERGSLMNFNSYLCRMQQKKINSFTFRKVLSYMIEEASKFFNPRETKNIKLANSGKNKENSPTDLHTISLKDKKRRTSGANNSQQFGVQNRIVKKVGKKVRRYNSQQNCGLRQNFNPSNHLFGIQKQQQKRLTIQNSQNPQHFRRETYQFNSTARQNRRSADNITFVYQNEIFPTQRNALDFRQQAAMNTNSSGSNWQISTENKNFSTKNNSISTGFRNNSKMMEADDGPLSNLKTIKSIVDYEGFQLDETIRLDLEKMETNAESRIG